jgi:hypothetical protein
MASAPDNRGVQPSGQETQHRRDADKRHTSANHDQGIGKPTAHGSPQNQIEDVGSGQRDKHKVALPGNAVLHMHRGQAFCPARQIAVRAANWLDYGGMMWGSLTGTTGLGLAVSDARVLGHGRALLGGDQAAGRSWIWRKKSAAVTAPPVARSIRLRTSGRGKRIPRSYRLIATSVTPTFAASCASVIDFASRYALSSIPPTLTAAVRDVNRIGR